VVHADPPHALPHRLEKRTGRMDCRVTPGNDERNAESEGCLQRRPLSLVTTGLDPVVHADPPHASPHRFEKRTGRMDCRVRPGNDERIAESEGCLQRLPLTLVTTGLDPVVHADPPHALRHRCENELAAWIAGSRPAMTRSKCFRHELSKTRVQVRELATLLPDCATLHPGYGGNISPSSPPGLTRWSMPTRRMHCRIA
jgi:hypothetical protein